MTTAEKIELLKLPPSKWLKYMPCTDPIDEQVYLSMMGFLIKECRLPWVEQIFVPGHPCFEEYDRMHQAYLRAAKRLNGTDYDEDLETMKDSLVDYAKILCLEMFNHGRKYEQMLQDEKQTI